MRTPDCTCTGTRDYCACAKAAANIQRLANVCMSRIVNGHRTGITQSLLIQIIHEAENIQRGLED